MWNQKHERSTDQQLRGSALSGDETEAHLKVSFSAACLEAFGLGQWSRGFRVLVVCLKMLLMPICSQGLHMRHLDEPEGRVPHFTRRNEGRFDVRLMENKLVNRIDRYDGLARERTLRKDNGSLCEPLPCSPC